MSHRDSVIKKNKELKKPMDLMNVGFTGNVGTAGGVPTDFEDFDFSTGWNKTGSVNYTSGGVLIWQAERDISGGQYIYKDMLGTTISDTEWTLRFKYRATQASGSGSNVLYFWGLSSGTANAYNNYNNFIGSHTLFNGSGNLHYLNVKDVVGGSMYSAADEVSSTNLSTTQYWIEMKRTSSTSYTITIFSDADYTNAVETMTNTCSANCDNLRYFFVSSRNNDSWQSGNCVLKGEIDDIQFWNSLLE